PHPPLVRPQLRERRPRHRRERDVVVGQVDDEAVEPVRDGRAVRTPRRVVGPEHEVVDEELRAPSEEVRQRGAPLVGLESILLVDPHTRQLLPPPRQVVAPPRELLLRLEQLEPGREPLFTCPGSVLRHRSCPPLARRRAPAATSASVPCSAAPRCTPGARAGSSRLPGWRRSDPWPRSDRTRAAAPSSRRRARPW